MSNAVKIVRTVHDLRRETAKWRGHGHSIALIPTMGAIHAGHISLMKLAKKKVDRTVISIFVNPTQFSTDEDLSHYPRDEAGDLRKLDKADTDLVWIPSVEEMYPVGFSTSIRAGTAAGVLEGTFRPKHFDGVTTVCAKLFNQVMPDIAIFGEKDFQQLAVLRQMVRDLNMLLELVGAPTKRDTDGLALSSRNAYLSAAKRKIAPALYATISSLAESVANGDDIPTSIVNANHELTSAGFTKIDYVDVRDAETIELPVSIASGRPLRVLAACWLDETRLIDNVAV